MGKVTLVPNLSCLFSTGTVMLTSSGLPKYMWGEALYSACYILNRIPYKDCDKTPYELWN